MIKAIIFDFGQVIIDYDFTQMYFDFEKRVGLPQGFVKNYYDKNWDAVILGDISLEKFMLDMQEAAAKKDLDFLEIWLEEMLKAREANTELLDLIKKLRKHYLVGLLSNASPARVAVDERIGIYKNFDFVLLSCREHLQKPDAKFYELALKETKSEPRDVVFIDDMEPNVSAAKDVGINGILYTDNKELIEDLKQLGIKI